MSPNNRILLKCLFIVKLKADKSWFFYYYTLHILIKLITSFFYLYYLLVFPLRISPILQTIWLYCFIHKLKSLLIIDVFRFLIASFMSSYFLNTLFTETNYSWLIYESIKFLVIITFIILVLLALFYHALFSS